MVAHRLHKLPRANVLGIEVPVATGARARLLGLAYLDRDAVGSGLLIPRCASVHTFGMRFPLDVFFLDQCGALFSVRHSILARRVLFARGAHAVLEIPAGEGGEILSLCH